MGNCYDTQSVKTSDTLNNQSNQANQANKANLSNQSKPNTNDKIDLVGGMAYINNNIFAVAHPFGIVYTPTY